MDFVWTNPVCTSRSTRQIAQRSYTYILQYFDHEVGASAKEAQFCNK